MSFAAADFAPVARSDAMEQFALADIDFHDGTVRVLYQSMPSLPQATRPGWTINVYVALLRADGTVENRLLASGQRHYSALLLRRGADEVYLLPRRESPDDAIRLERRSIADGSLQGAMSHPWLSLAAGEGQTIYPVADGGFFLARQGEGSEAGRGLAWKRFSPAGSLQAEGEWLRPSARAMLAGVFPVADGGLGMTVRLSPHDGDHLETDIPSPVVAEIGGRRLEAWSFAETRALLANPEGQVAWVSPALERDLMWKGEMAIPDSLPPAEMMAQNARQMDLMERTVLAHAGQRQLEHRAWRGFDELKAAPGGWGMLLRQVASRDREPPVHGTWYLVLGDDGGVERQVRLEAAADRMNARFERFLPRPDGGLVVAGRRDRGSAFHVTVLDAEGERRRTVTLEHPDTQFDELAGDPASPWLIGHGWDDASGKTVLWVRRVNDLAGGAAPDASPAPQTSGSGARSTPAPGAAPELGPVEGCSCDCDEFERFRADMQAVKDLPRNQQMQLMSDPNFQARMQCMASCAMAYASCSR